MAPASASFYDYKLSGSVDGALGYVWFDFEMGRYGGNFTPTVSDNKCDSHSVYVSIYTDGGLYQKFQNSQGCNHTQSWGWRSFTYKYNQPASTVKYVYVKVCVADRFGDTCATSARKYELLVRGRRLLCSRSDALLTGCSVLDRSVTRFANSMHRQGGCAFGVLGLP